MVPSLNSSGYGRDILKQTFLIIETECLNGSRNIGGRRLNAGNVIDGDGFAELEGVNSTSVKSKFGLVELAIRMSVVDVFNACREGYSRLLELFTLNLKDITLT